MSRPQPLIEAAIVERAKAVVGRVSRSLCPEATPNLELHPGESIDNVLLGLGVLVDPERPTNIWPRGARRASPTNRFAKCLLYSH